MSVVPAACGSSGRRVAKLLALLVLCLNAGSASKALAALREKVAAGSQPAVASISSSAVVGPSSGELSSHAAATSELDAFLRGVITHTHSHSQQQVPVSQQR